MSHVPLSNILTAQVVTVAPETPLADALARMEEHRISCVVAVDTEHRPVGIFTEQDVISLLAANALAQDMRIADAIVDAPLTAPLAMDYREAYQLMAAKGYRHLLAVDDAGMLAGVISEGDFLQHLGMEYLVEHKTVSAIMTRDVSVLNEQATLADAVTCMSRQHIGCIVVTRGRIPVGIVTERDMVHLARIAGDLAGISIAQAMSSPVQTIAADCFMQDAARRMLSGNIRRLAVVDEQAALVGLVTRHDIVKTLQGRYIEFLHESLTRKNRELDDTQQQLDLLEKKLLYLNLMEQVDDAIFIADKATGKILDANIQACQCLNYSREALLQRHLGDIAPAIFDAAAMPALHRQLADNGHLTLQTRHRCSDGREFPVEIKLRCIAHGDREYIVAVARDQTLWHQQNRELHLLRQAFQASATAVIITDTAAVIQWANPAFCALTGYSLEECVSRSIKSLVNSGQQSRAFYKRMWNTILSGQVWHGELINKQKNGSVYTEEMTITPVYGDQGTIEYFIAVKQDVTERKQMEKRFIENERFLNTIIDSEPECVKLLDRQNRLIRMNRAGLNMIEAKSDAQVLGQKVLGLIMPKYRKRFAALTAGAFAGEAGELEFEITSLRGTRRWLATHAVPLRGANGEITPRWVSRATLPRANTPKRAFLSSIAFIPC